MQPPNRAMQRAPGFLGEAVKSRMHLVIFKFSPVACLIRESNPGHFRSKSDALTRPIARPAGGGGLGQYSKMGIFRCLDLGGGANLEKVDNMIICSQNFPSWGCRDAHLAPPLPATGLHAIVPLSYCDTTKGQVSFIFILTI